MPSNSIESCARLRETVPLSAFGQMNRPRSSRLAKRQRPSPSNHNSFTISPRRPRKTNTWPENGCLLKYRLHLRAQPLKAATHIRHAGCEPDACAAAQLDHLRKLSRIVRSRAASAPLPTLIEARPCNSMWIAPDSGRGSCFTGCCPSAKLSPLAAAITTGNSAVERSPASVNSPLRYLACPEGKTRRLRGSGPAHRWTKPFPVRRQQPQHFSRPEWEVSRRLPYWNIRVRTRPVSQGFGWSQDGFWLE